MLYTSANDRVNTYIATTVERAHSRLQYAHGYTVGWLGQQRKWLSLDYLRGRCAGRLPTYKKVGRSHFLKFGRNCIQFSRAKRGATAVEYALICAGIALAVLTVVNTLGAKVAATFGKVVAGLG